MSIVTLSADQTDALQEIVNIAMGQAGDSLARVLDTFVVLSVPRIRLIEAEQVSQSVAALMDDATTEVTAVRQSFSSHLRGEAIVIFTSGSVSALSDLMGYEHSVDAQTEKEVLFDVSNILVGACLNGVAEQLDADLTFSAPSIISENVTPDRVLTGNNLPWNYCLKVEVNFTLEEKNFKSHLLIMMAEDAIATLGESLNEFIAAI